jgi:hypothetical protein
LPHKALIIMSHVAKRPLFVAGRQPSIKSRQRRLCD